MALDTASTKTTRVQEVSTMTTVCPNGHDVQADDYCDICGAPIACRRDRPPARAPALPRRRRRRPATPGRGVRRAGPAAGLPELLGTDNPADALFCEACGYDFTTGTMPRPRRASPTDRRGRRPTLAGSGAGAPTPSPRAVRRSSGWPRSGSTPTGTPRRRARSPCPSPGPAGRRAAARQSLLIGRAVAEPQHPPRHRLRGRHRGEPPAGPADHRRPALVGRGPRSRPTAPTSVRPAARCPRTRSPPGQRRELDEDDRIYVGAWTRLVVRRATPEEQNGPA